MITLKKVGQNTRQALNLKASLVFPSVAFITPVFLDCAICHFSPGELWLGLETIHQLTSDGSYSLRITMKDFDGQSYVAVYDQFQVFIT